MNYVEQLVKTVAFKKNERSRRSRQARSNEPSVEKQSASRQPGTDRLRSLVAISMYEMSRP